MERRKEKVSKGSRTSEVTVFYCGKADFVKIMTLFKLLLLENHTFSVFEILLTALAQLKSCHPGDSFICLQDYLAL